MRGDEAALPPGWVEGTLADFVKPRGEKLLPSEMPDAVFLGMDHVEAHTTRIIGGALASEMKSAAARFYAGDILYGRLRPYLNKVARPSFDGLASAEFIVFPDTELVHSQFLKHRLNAADFVSFASHLNEGDRPRVGFDQIGAFHIRLPPSNEQDRIVAKIEELFSELDKGVEALTTARQQLTAYRHAVLKDAFEGKLTADWRLNNLTRLRNAKEIGAFLEDARRAALEMNGRAKSKPPAPFDSADLPECPMEWALVSMDSLCHHITSGSREWSRFYDRGISTFIMAQNVRPGRYDGSVIQHVDPPMENAETERTRVQTDDILVTIVGANTGDVCRFPLKSMTHYVCQSVALMRLSCPEYARFVELYFQSRSGGQRQYTRYIYGAGRPHLSFEQLKQTVVPIPDPREAAQIVSAADTIFSELEAAESMIDAELVRATNLRHSVLRAAFSGQLVAQDPTDGPASVLLERIRTEREEEAPKKGRYKKNGKKEAA